MEKVGKRVTTIRLNKNPKMITLVTTTLVRTDTEDDMLTFLKNSGTDSTLST